MKKLLATLCPVIVLCTMCIKQTDNQAVDLSSLGGGTYTLKVDRISQSPDVQYPHDSLDESHYTATTEDIQYLVKFSEDGLTATIEPGTISGEKINDGKTSKYYDLTSGLMAGGRLIIWIKNNCFEAEYTKYGSGVPIIRSERGKLQ